MLLALESSADDSCASVVRSDKTILSNVVLKQHAELVVFTRQKSSFIHIHALVIQFLEVYILL